MFQWAKTKETQGSTYQFEDLARLRSECQAQAKFILENIPAKKLLQSLAKKFAVEEEFTPLALAKLVAKKIEGMCSLPGVASRFTKTWSPYSKFPVWLYFLPLTPFKGLEFNSLLLYTCFEILMTHPEYFRRVGDSFSCMTAQEVDLHQEKLTNQIEEDEARKVFVTKVKKILEKRKEEDPNESRFH